MISSPSSAHWLRIPGAAAVAVVAAFHLSVQAAPETSKPGKAPAPEIAPAKPAATPAPGEKTAETPKTDLSPGSKIPEPVESPTERKSVDILSDGDLETVLSTVKERYVAPAALSEAALKRATVQGILDRLGAGATLIKPGAPAASTTSPFKSEVIDNRIGYLRLGSLNAENLTLLDTALTGFSEKKIRSLVIDLRATPGGADFSQAADVCRRFVQKGKVLFTVRRPESKQAEIFTSKDDVGTYTVLTVLVDADTAGGAEIVAGSVRALAGAVVIGQKTKGEAAEFAEFPLKSGLALRLAVAEVVLPGDLSLVPDGVIPDVPVEAPSIGTAALMKDQLEKGISTFLYETERPRMNEAALVSGATPELDAIQAAQKSKGEKLKGPVRDAALQRAVDLITAVTVFEKTSGPAKARK